MFYRCIHDRMTVTWKCMCVWKAKQNNQAFGTSDDFCCKKTDNSFSGKHCVVGYRPNISFWYACGIKHTENRENRSLCNLLTLNKNCVKTKTFSKKLKLNLLPKLKYHWMIEADGARWWQRAGNRLTDPVVPGCWSPCRPDQRASIPLVVAARPE